MTALPKRPRSKSFAPVLLPLQLLWCLYAALVFLALGLAAMLCTLLLPGLAARRAVARAAAGGFLFLTGMPVRLRHPGRLPAGQCVVVANHASYLDGVAFKAALPGRFGFVIKREMDRVPLAGLLLRRIGSEFVERFDRQRGAKDARRVLRTARNGHSLVFFPEGTFTHQPGLLRFHTGAFVAAVRAGCPVVPAVIRGSRTALPPDGRLPRPARVEIVLLPPLLPRGSSAQDVAELRDRARAAILAELGEPDLTCCGDTAHPPRTARARSARASSS